MRAQAQRAAVLGQRCGVDQLGARLGQRPFVGRREIFHRTRCVSTELQHRVAEKFQPLIVRRGRVLLMRDGRMRQRQPQQAFVAELVAETFLKFGEIRHGSVEIQPTPVC